MEEKKEFMTQAKVLSLAMPIQAFFGTFAICNIGNISVGNILSILLLGLLWMGSSQVKKAEDGAALPHRFGVVTTGLAILFAALYMAAEHKNLTGTFDNRMFQAGFLFATALGLFLMFRKCIRFLMILCAGQLERTVTHTVKPFSTGKKALVFGGLLLCWLPWFLYNYPAVMTPDSISQFSQAIGVKEYSNHHPVIHTLLLQICYRAGYWITHNVDAGIACYVVVQMCLLAGIETACLSLLAKRGVSRRMLVVWFLFWGIMPYNGIYAVTIWKDVLFAAFVLLFSMVLFLLLEAGNITIKEHGRLLVLLAVAGFLICTFRSNGMYIYLFVLPFALIVFRRNLRVVCAPFLLALVAALIVKGPVYDAYGVQKSHMTEWISIPLQQVARVVTEERPLSEEQTALINQVVDSSFIPEYYNPVISDPIKALVTYNNAEYLEENRGDFLKLWIDLGLTYPGDYFEAYVDQTEGYWYPELASMRTYEGISENEVGLTWTKIWSGMVPIKIAEVILKLTDQVPVYGILWSIGAFTWGMLFLIAYQFLYGSKKYLLAFLPFIDTILTLMIATPVASDLRYAYPVFLGMPFMIAVVSMQCKPVTGVHKTEQCQRNTGVR